MKRHFFIAPVAIDSPRWQQAFPQAIRVTTLPAQLTSGDCCWCYVGDLKSFTDITSKIPEGVIVIAMTANENFAEARQLLALGASGYVHYLAVSQVLISVADTVASGSMWLGADLMRQLVISSAKLFETVETQPDKQHEKRFALLTDREKSVAELAAQGKTNKEIARDLSITERTVKAHLGSVFEKCQIRDRLQLVLLLKK